MRPSNITIRAALVVCLAVTPVAIACDGDDDATTTSASETTATVDSTTSSSDTTTTAPPTTAAPDTTGPAATTTAPTPTTIDTNTLASGSGCTPGPGALPDGEWFGFVATASADDLEFDLACWFEGDAAIAATAEDGEESPPPNDYYVRNTNPALRTVSVASGAEVIWVPDIGNPAQATIDYPTWLVERVTRGIELQPGVWIRITGGDVAEIEEQWTP